jgi:hypothetical protein
MIKEGFRHLAAAGIVDTYEQDSFLYHLIIV